MRCCSPRPVVSNGAAPLSGCTRGFVVLPSFGSNSKSDSMTTSPTVKTLIKYIAATACNLTIVECFPVLLLRVWLLKYFPCSVTCNVLFCFAHLHQISHDVPFTFPSLVLSKNMSKGACRERKREIWHK